MQTYIADHIVPHMSSQLDTTCVPPESTRRSLGSYVGREVQAGPMYGPLQSSTYAQVPSSPSSAAVLPRFLSCTLHAPSHFVVFVLAFCKDIRNKKATNCLNIVYCSMSVQHMAETSNAAADALSRNELNSFFASLPQAAPTPTTIPEQVVQLIVLERPDRTSRRWRDLFPTTLRKE